MESKVEIRGIKELGRAFKQIDDDLAPELKSRFMGIASDVATTAQGKVPRISGKAAGSIKPRASVRGASIAFGGTAAPYMPWLNFGGRVGRRKSIVRERVTPDRYIYTTIGQKRDDISDAADDAIVDVARHAGFETGKGF